MRRVRKSFYVAIWFTFLALFVTSAPTASVIRQVILEEVVQNAEFVFEGQVISEETRPSPIDGRTFTYFTFDITDVIKGSYSGNYIELGFAGGTLNDVTLCVSGMHMPEIGEKGIYFVESLKKELVHPLYGWHQGHYLVVQNPSDGIEKIVPVRTPPSGMIAAPTVTQFKQNLRDIIRENPHEMAH